MIKKNGVVHFVVGPSSYEAYAALKRWDWQPLSGREWYVPNSNGAVARILETREQLNGIIKPETLLFMVPGWRDRISCVEAVWKYREKIDKELIYPDAEPRKWFRRPRKRKDIKRVGGQPTNKEIFSRIRNNHIRQLRCLVANTKSYIHNRPDRDFIVRLIDKQLVALGASTTEAHDEDQLLKLNSLYDKEKA